MPWNYRVLKTRYESVDPTLSCDLYKIIETWYDDEGNIDGWSEPNILLWADYDDLKRTVLDLLPLAFN